MTNTASFRVLMNELADGREGAAAVIVDEYTAALVAVARRQIGAKLARRVDPEDVVQSAYRSFFARMGRGEYDLGNGEELWKLLLTITLNKVRKQGNFHHRQKRNVEAEGAEENTALGQAARSNEPSPEDAAMIVDEVTALLETLQPEDRPIVELRLQGYNSVEIAGQTGRAERTVRRFLERIERRLREQCR